MRIEIPPEKRKQQFKILIKRARERIREAEILLEKKHYNGAISRAYYGFFEAGHAALITKGITAKTHAGIIMLFSLHFVKNRKIPVKFIRFFKKAQESREEADYHFLREFTREEAQTTIDTAKQFIKTVRETVAPASE